MESSPVAPGLQQAPWHVAPATSVYDHVIASNHASLACGVGPFLRWDIDVYIVFAFAVKAQGGLSKRGDE